MPKRRFNRIHIESQARVKSGEQLFEGLTENLSLTGLFIRTERRLPVGNKAEIIFTLPSACSSSEFTVKGVVVRNGVHGLAFQFGSLDEDSFSRIRTVINIKSPNRLKEYYPV